MAKKRIEQPADDEQEPVEYESVEPKIRYPSVNDSQVVSDWVIEEVLGSDNVEPEVVEDESGGFLINDPEFIDALNDKVTATITKPGGAAVALDTPKDEPTYRVTLTLPYGVLVALLEPEHTDADVQLARAYHLISTFGDNLTQLGIKVAAGFDQTAVRHKMLAAWREQHNRGVGGVK